MDGPNTPFWHHFWFWLLVISVVLLIVGIFVKEALGAGGWADLVILLGVLGLISGILAGLLSGVGSTLNTQTKNFSDFLNTPAGGQIAGAVLKAAVI